MTTSDELRLAEIEAELASLMLKVKALWAERKAIRGAEKTRIDQAKRAERALRDHEFAKRSLSYDQLADLALSVYAEQTGRFHEKNLAVADALPRGVGLKRARQLLIHGAFRVFDREAPMSVKLVRAAIGVNQDLGIWQLAPTIDLTDAPEDLIAVFTEAFKQSGFTVNFAKAA